jgi:hypothetical protein
MKILSICLAVLLAIFTIVSAYHAFITPSLLTSDFIPKTVVDSIQKECMISSVVEFTLTALSLYLTIKRKYLITVIVFAAYLVFYFLQPFFY